MSLVSIDVNLFGRLLKIFIHFQELEQDKKELLQKIKENLALTQQECERDKKISMNEMLAVKYKELKNIYERKVSKKEALEGKIQELTEEIPYQERVKHKAYLESSLKYLNEKRNTLKGQTDEEAKQVQENGNKYELLKKTVKEKRESIKILQQELKKFGELFLGLK